MSFTSGRPERRVRISDPRALRALAHPLRLALLDRLMSFGEQTAAQCAEAVGSTASNCSYHLRVLARVGLVEPGTSADGREHPWRSAATGVAFGPREPAGSPASAAAARALDELSLAREEALTRTALARRDAEPPEWRTAEAHNGYALRLTAAELEQLVGEIDRLVRPYIGLTREEAPEGAEVAYLRLVAFRHPEAP
ncbi:MAG TPA: helix-turn-helix domain-containing protein [Solirubrobacteraceae bacterium]|nr:helix-turn-helix domain-containing protein [Solirubrobacteraceae bacterium]